MRVQLILVLAAAFTLTAGGKTAEAHCQIPCGIYNDQLRVDLIKEHADTIAKSMKMIEDLGKETPVNYNQLVRWVDTKEHHADEIQEIVSSYFMTQRIAPGDAAYNEKLKALHEILLAAMKCKQTIDPTNVEKIKAALGRFEILYFKEHSHHAKPPVKKPQAKKKTP